MLAAAAPILLLVGRADDDGAAHDADNDIGSDNGDDDDRTSDDAHHAAASRRVHTAGGGYTVTFPGQPTPLNQQTTLADGSTLPYVIYSYETTVDGDARELGASAVPYPPGTAINANGIISGAVAAFPGAHLIGGEAIELQGLPGAQFSIDLTRGGAPQYYMSRVFTDGTTKYQLYYVGGTIGPTDPDVLAFFDSFRLPEGG